MRSPRFLTNSVSSVSAFLKGRVRLFRQITCLGRQLLDGWHCALLMIGLGRALRIGDGGNGNDCDRGAKHENQFVHGSLLLRVSPAPAGE
jgi:hypothetical protein